MKSTYISGNLAKFKVTRNPFYLAKAISLLISQKRIHELLYGFYCSFFFPPSAVEMCLSDIVNTILSDRQSWLHCMRLLSKGDLLNIFGGEYAIHSLPADFAGAGRESIVYEPDILIIGEYGEFRKRIFCVTHKSCAINDYYTNNPNVRHIHAVYKSRASRDILVTTGDTAKFLDLWHMHNDKMVFRKRLKKYLAGHTAITEIGGKYYLGTDFSSRPNYIEELNGEKFFFPRDAYKMYVIGFYQYKKRYILSINHNMEDFGGQHTLSVFDVVTKKFIFCDYLDCIQTNTLNKDLQRTSKSVAKIRALFACR